MTGGWGDFLVEEEDRNKLHLVRANGQVVVFGDLEGVWTGSYHGPVTQ